MNGSDIQNRAASDGNAVKRKAATDEIANRLVAFVQNLPHTRRPENAFLPDFNSVFPILRAEPRETLPHSVGDDGAAQNAVKAFAAMGPGLAGMAMFVDPDNTMNIIWAFVGFGIALVSPFIATFIFYKDEARPAVAANSEAAEDEAVKPGSLVSPLQGTVVMLNDVKDEVFSTGVLGKGVTVLPTKGELYSLVDGEITMLRDTKHAIAVKDASGSEILMHIGMDTVALNGKGYEPQVKVGGKVRKGQRMRKIFVGILRAIKPRPLSPSPFRGGGTKIQT